MEALTLLAIACIAIAIGMIMVVESGKNPEKYGKIGLPGALIALVGAICIFALYFNGLL